jgi:DNA-directed RNA polymerase subunit M/transcription elongation factor TFIIS
MADPVNDIFCDLCDNMTYVRTAETSGLLSFCNYCNTTQPIDTARHSIVMSDISYNDEQAKYQHFLTPRIHDDPTLPRVSDIACPNAACTRAEGQDNSVLFIKYDAQNMCFLYSCSHCKHFWGPDGIGLVRA